jgi:hypothetical protein
MRENLMHILKNMEDKIVKVKECQEVIFNVQDPTDNAYQFRNIMFI